MPRRDLLVKNKVLGADGGAVELERHSAEVPRGIAIVGIDRVVDMTKQGLTWPPSLRAEESTD